LGIGSLLAVSSALSDPRGAISPPPPTPKPQMPKGMPPHVTGGNYAQSQRVGQPRHPPALPNPRVPVARPSQGVRISGGVQGMSGYNNSTLANSLGMNVGGASRINLNVMRGVQKPAHLAQSEAVLGE